MDDFKELEISEICETPNKPKCPRGSECKCIRFRDWAITIWEHKGHFEQVEKMLSRYNYVGQFETCPKTGKVHGHFFVQTPSRNPIARHIFDEAFPGGHFEKVRNPLDYEAYCQKDDSVLVDEYQQPKRFQKGDLKLIGTSSRERETELERLWLEMVGGTSLTELLRTDKRAIRYIEKLERLEKRLGGSHLEYLLNHRS